MRARVPRPAPASRRAHARAHGAALSPRMPQRALVRRAGRAGSLRPCPGGRGARCARRHAARPGRDARAAIYGSRQSRRHPPAREGEAPRARPRTRRGAQRFASPAPSPAPFDRLAAGPRAARRETAQRRGAKAPDAHGRCRPDFRRRGEEDAADSVLPRGQGDAGVRGKQVRAPGGRGWPAPELLAPAVWWPIARAAGPGGRVRGTCRAPIFGSSGVTRAGPRRGPRETRLPAPPSQRHQ